MDFVFALVETSVRQVLISLLHNWPYLLASIVIAALLTLYVDTRKVAAFLGRHRSAGTLVATATAVGTPLCSCGTTAVVLGMIAATVPWAPVVAFMVASPLSSPEGMVYTAGLFGWPFAIGMFAASALLGLAGGALASVLERRGLLKNQLRLALGGASTAEAPIGGRPASSCACGTQPVAQVGTCGCSAPAPRKSKLARLPAELFTITKRLLPMFVGFAFVGFLLNGLIPTAWVPALFGSGKLHGVPLAATLGLPLYINSEGSLPMVRAFLDSGMSPGAAMAFLIAGSGTSLGAIAGVLTIARLRVVALVVGVLWIGAMAAGFAYNALLALRVIG